MTRADAICEKHAYCEALFQNEARLTATIAERDATIAALRAERDELLRDLGEAISLTVIPAPQLTYREGMERASEIAAAADKSTHPSDLAEMIRAEARAAPQPDHSGGVNEMVGIGSAEARATDSPDGDMTEGREP